MKFRLIRIALCLALASASVQAQSLADVLSSIQERKQALEQRNQVEWHIRLNYDGGGGTLPAQNLIQWQGLSNEFPEDTDTAFLNIDQRIALLNQAVDQMRSIQRQYLNIRKEDVAKDEDEETEEKIGALRPYLLEDFPDFGRVSASNYHATLRGLAASVRRLNVLEWPFAGFKKTCYTAPEYDENNPNPPTIGPAPVVTASGAWETSMDDVMLEECGLNQIIWFSNEFSQTIFFYEKVALFAGVPNETNQLGGNVGVIIRNQWSPVDFAQVTVVAPNSWDPDDGSCQLVMVQNAAAGDNYAMGAAPQITLPVSWTGGTVVPRGFPYPTGYTLHDTWGDYGDLDYDGWETKLEIWGGVAEGGGEYHVLGRRLHSLFVPTFTKGLDATGKAAKLDLAERLSASPPGDAKPVLQPAPSILVGIPLGVGLDGGLGGMLGITHGDEIESFGLSRKNLISYSYDSPNSTVGAWGEATLEEQPDYWELPNRFDFASSLRFIGPVQDFHVVYETARNATSRGADLPAMAPTEAEEDDIGCRFFFRNWDLPRIKQIVSRDFIVNITPQGHYKNLVEIYRLPTDHVVDRTPGAYIEIGTQGLDLTAIRVLEFDNPDAGQGDYPDVREMVHITDGSTIYKVWRTGDSNGDGDNDGYPFKVASTGKVIPADLNFEVNDGTTVLVAKQLNFSGVGNVNITHSVEGTLLSTEVINDDDWYWYLNKQPNVRTITSGNRTILVTNTFAGEESVGSHSGWYPASTEITDTDNPTINLAWNSSGRMTNQSQDKWSVAYSLESGSLKSESNFNNTRYATTWTEWTGDTRIKTYDAPYGDISTQDHAENTIRELTLGNLTGAGLPGLPLRLTHRDGTETRWTWNVAADHSGSVSVASGKFSRSTLVTGQRQIFSWNEQGYPTSTQSQLVAGGTVQTSSTTAGNFTDWGAPQQFTDNLTGLTTSFTYDGALHRLTSIQNALGLTTTFGQYDIFNRPCQVTSNGITADHNYSGLGVTTSYSDGGVTPGSQSSFSTNAEGTEMTQSHTWGGVTQSRDVIRGQTNTTLTGTHSLLGASSTTIRNNDASTASADSPTLPFGGVTGDALSVVNGLLVTQSAIADRPGTFSETHSDSWGRPHKIITPSKSGSGSTETLFSYSSPAAAIQRIITTEPNGRIHITESEANGTITRAGIDVNGNGSLGTSDRYTESITTVGTGKITTILKVTEDSGLREILRTDWTPASGVTVTKLNGNEETLTSTPDYNAKTVKVESSKGWETTTAINPLGLPTGNLLKGIGIPTTNLTPVWRADGSLEKITLNIGGENHEATINPNGTLASLTLPGQGNILGGHHIDEDGETLTLLGTTYHRSHDGTLREIITDRDSEGEALAGHRSTFSPDNNGGYKDLIEPVGAADTTVHFNAALAPTGKTYADNSGTSITYSGELPTSILSPRGHSIGLVYSNDGAKDLIETAFPALSSGPFPIPGHSEAYGYDRAGRINFLGDHSGGRALVYQNGRHVKTHYTTGLLKGYEIIPGRDTAGRHTGTQILRDNHPIHTVAIASNEGSNQILNLASHGITATPQRDFAGNLTGYQWSDGTHTVTQHWTRGPGGRIHAAGSNVPAAPQFLYLIDENNPAESFDPKGRRLKCETSGGTWTYIYGLGGQLAKAEHPTLGTFHYHFDPIGRRTVEADPSPTHHNLTDLLNRTTAWKHSEAKTLTLKAHPDARVWYNGDEIQNFDGEHPVELGTPGTTGQWIPWQTLAILEGAGEGAGNPPQNPHASPDAKAAQSGAVWIPPAAETLHYDAAGNRLDNAQWDYGWDAKNQLTRARTKNHTTAPQAFDLTFTYDSEGRRVKKHVIELANGAIKTEKIITYLWDDWDLLYERHQLPSGLTTLERKYLWGPDLADGAAGGAGGLLLITETRGSQTQHLIPLYDGTGHVIALTNLQKDLLAQYTYGPFGESIHATGPLAQSNPWRYATKYLDEETGLYYFGHRYFDPVTGQWLSREPLGESESINLYAYCGNDPVNKVDVLGLAEYDREQAKNLIVLRELAQMMPEYDILYGFQSNQFSWNLRSSPIARNVYLNHGEERFIRFDYGFEQGMQGVAQIAGPVLVTAGGAAQIGGGIALLLVPEPTMGTKVAAAYNIAAGADLLGGYWFTDDGKGLRQRGLEATGMSEGWAAGTMYAIDVGVNVGALFGPRLLARGAAVPEVPEPVGIRTQVYGWIDDVAKSVPVTRGAAGMVDNLPIPVNPTVYVDENVFFMTSHLRRQGYNVVQVTSGMKDAAIRQMVEANRGVLITRNYKDFRGMAGVVRVGSGNPLSEQLRITINSLEAARINPEIWLRMQHIPASGFNKGTVIVPRR